MPERRQHERFDVLAQVELDRGGELESLIVLNISAGGVLLRNDPELAFEVGQAIRVHFDVPELAPAFALDAKIVRVVAATTKPALLGAMWTSSDPAATAALAPMLWTLKGA